MTEEELARMAKLEEQMEMRTTMVKGKAKVGERSDMDKGKSIMGEEAHKFSQIKVRLKATKGLDTFKSVEVEGL
ncbi:hypothetical protein Golob_026252 [Gossypium lobatum]|uniref:Uncharacterized protein n=1 Tax=Gossypium lobatum TaxID=34289 RepID=A0A7J8LUK2_9ROSI|nr:hypothetical protein [Gossypium lobatum]